MQPLYTLVVVGEDAPAANPQPCRRGDSEQPLANVCQQTKGVCKQMRGIRAKWDALSARCAERSHKQTSDRRCMQTHLNLVLPKVESMRPTGPSSPRRTTMPRNKFMSVPGLKRLLQMTVCSSTTRSTWPQTPRVKRTSRAQGVHTATYLPLLALSFEYAQLVQLVRAV